MVEQVLRSAESVEKVRNLDTRSTLANGAVFVQEVIGKLTGVELGAVKDIDLNATIASTFGEELRAKIGEQV